MLQHDRRRPHADDEIARHEVSEDGVNWRAFDPQRDAGRVLHKRIEFAPLRDERR